jgi:DNA-binding CsgD family transcriptional regulator
MELSRKISDFRNSIMSNVLTGLSNNFVTHEYIKDTSGNFIDCCLNQANSAGFAKVDDFIGTNDRDLLNPVEANKIALNDKFVLQKDEPLIVTEHITRFDGKKIVVTSFKISLTKGKAKALGLMGFSIIHALKPLLNTNEFNLSLIQLECLLYLVKGCTMKEISQHLSRSPKTIEHCLEAIKLKLNVTRKSDLVSKALQIPYIREKL